MGARVLHRLKWLASRFGRQHRAIATVEFALVGLALTLFLMVIINVGMLGLTLGGLVHGVQSAARAAAVQAANNYATNGSISCPTQAAIVSLFNQYADPPLAPATGTTSNPSVTATWTNNGNDTVTTEPPGLYLTLTATVRWVPIGLAAFSNGINLTITTVATVPGSAQSTSTC